MSSTLSDGTESLAGSKELGGAPRYLAGGETPYFASSSSTECSGDIKRVVGKRDERAEFLCEMADRHLSTK